ncbi:LysE family translocator [Parvibaculaceae bacterium PLY_AMNH_Bact1]|nr:LysE family translocator [Parvibaculaceae bacterium PLY_AMNH_Bact1]
MLSTLLPMFVFAIASTGTPGPNNIMVMTSGANFGYWRTVPHMLGIALGFSGMVVALGLGFSQLFAVYPQVHEMLKWMGTGYLLFLAWKIATAAKPEDAEANGAKAEGAPLTFVQAALFQWVNPKAWMVGIAGLTAFTSNDGNYELQTLIIAGVFLAVSFPLSSFWCSFGTIIGRFLTSLRSLRIFNGAMATLIVGSIVLLYV